MKIVKLSKRLEAIARYIRPGDAVIDVGTDHGYIPAYLAQKGYARRLIAADINKGPLMRARLTAEEFGVAERIEFVLADGLSGIDTSKLDAIIVAGMGGETIAGILEKAKGTLKPDTRIILQPQTKLKELVSRLNANGLKILDATLVLDEGRIYEVLLVTASADGIGADPISILSRKRDPLLPDYIDRQIVKTRRALNGIRQAGGPDLDRVREIEAELSGLERLKEETEAW